MRKFCLCLLVALAATLAPSVRAAAPATCPGNHGQPDHAFTGTFDESVEGSHILIPFDVPEDSTHVRVKICYDQPDMPTSSQIKHTLDLAIYEQRQEGDDFWDEDEFRGWGGSSRSNTLITAEANTTVGYLPGEIEPGTWAAEIGVAAVAGDDEGDSDGTVAWRLETFTDEDPADLDKAWEPTPYNEEPALKGPGWYKGDFHVHAEHSNPSDASMRDVFDFAFRPPPMGAGLDFITLSDYVTTRQWDEIGSYQNDYREKLIMRSAEVITYRGHINNHNSATFVDYRTGPIYQLRDDGALELLRDAQPASRIFDDIHAAGGYTQINHPTTFPAAVPGFSNICRGCSWEYSDAETNWDKVDSIEVGTGPGGTSQPPEHEIGPNPFTPLAIRWWDDLRNRGYEVTAVGSSDDHKAGSGTDITQSPIGEGTTVVYAEELSEQGVTDAILAGHAYVKFFSADGPDLRFEASATQGDMELHGIMGDTLASATAHFTAKVIGGEPSPEPRLLVVMRNGVPYRAIPVTSDDFVFEFDAAEPGIYRLQLQRMTSIEALTNPITLSPETPPRGTRSASLRSSSGSAGNLRSLHPVPLGRIFGLR